MKTYKEFITELNKFELALKGGKLALKTLKKIGLKSRPGTNKVPVKDIFKLRLKNKPVSFGKKDRISKLAVDRKSIHPPTADAAQAKITDRKVELIKSRNNMRRENFRKQQEMKGKLDDLFKKPSAKRPKDKS